MEDADGEFEKRLGALWHQSSECLANSMICNS